MSQSFWKEWKLLVLGLLFLTNLHLVLTKTNDTQLSLENQFVEVMFNEFGHGGVIRLEDFRRLIRQVDNDKHSQHGKQETSEPECVEHGDNFNKTQLCMNASDILSEFGIDPQNGIASYSNFKLLCPAIVYQLQHRHCEQRALSNEEPGTVTWTVWLYASTGVVIISIMGFVCVLMVKIIVNKFLFKTIVQFLVAMAVGALSGDALLHLLPHALAEPQVDGHSHQGSNLVFKGLVALGGIFSFFLTQRLLQLCNGTKNERTNSGPSKRFARTSDQTVGEKLCDHRYNSCLYRDEDAVPASDNESYELEKVNCETGVPLKRARKRTNGHGHSHDVPQSLSSVVWMVIVGDGIHNFIDGLAIGAAFSESITGGIGTCVAVLCHELPHELGDFAMLLQKGMPMRRALQFNCLSSVICFVGMIVGLSLGNVSSASSWVFAFAGGIFLYLALVSMMPELNTETVEGKLLVLQCFGILCGSTIMLLIALFEHDLQQFIS